MSRKIMQNLFSFAKVNEAENLVLSEAEEILKINYYLAGGGQKNFSISRKYSESIKGDILNLIEDEDFELAKIKKRPICYRKNGLSLDFLLSVVNIGDALKIIFDFKKKENEKNWRLAETGINNKDKKKLLDLLEKGRGLFLISGPKMAGKSSTLKAILRELKEGDKSICLLGDNKESDEFIKMELTANSFELAKKADFDIIAIDEIKNKESLAQAFRLSACGKLVIAIIEADNLKILAKKIKTAPWPEAEKINLIRAIIFQRLVKLRRLINNKKDKRQEIARFKIISFKKK